MSSAVAGFPSLVRAMGAIVRGDGEALRKALIAAEPGAVLHQAVRHKCTGPLLAGISSLGARDPQLRALLTDLRAHGRVAMLQNFAVERQLAAIVAALDGAGAEPVLLKGAARLHQGARNAQWNALCDLDLLIRKEDAEAAIAALVQLGYTQPCDAAEAGRYRRLHHHLAPLIHSGEWKPVELHLALAPPQSLSLRTDWEALAPYLQVVEGMAGRARCLNELGTALHLAIHGIGLDRLYDVVQLALLFGERPELYGEVGRLLAAERIQPIALRAGVRLAARYARLQVPEEAEVQGYLNWAMRREDLPDSLRSRAQFVDAWYGNGRRIFGPATRLALPHFGPGWPLADAVLAPVRTIGRVASSLSAAACATRMML